MAPKKENAAPALKGPAAEKAVLEYLISQNRPYGATDISANLASTCTMSKPACAKILSDLAEKGQVEVKTWGKQSIYGPTQAEDGWAVNDFGEAEAEIKGAKEEEQSLREELRKVEAKKKALDAAPSTEQLPEKIAVNKGKLEAVKAQLDPLIAAADQSPSGSSAELDKRLPALLTELDSLRKLSAARKKWHTELGFTLREATGKSNRDSIWESVGGDEDVGEVDGREFERAVWERVAREESDKPKITLAGAFKRKR